MNELSARQAFIHAKLRDTNPEAADLIDQLRQRLAEVEAEAHAAELLAADRLAKLALAEQDARLHRAVERAAKELPTGWILHVAVESGAGWVELFDADGNETGLSDGRTLAEQIDAAIDASGEGRP